MKQRGRDEEENRRGIKRKRRVKTNKASKTKNLIKKSLVNEITNLTSFLVTITTNTTNYSVHLLFFFPFSLQFLFLLNKGKEWWQRKKTNERRIAYLTPLYSYSSSPSKEYPVISSPSLFSSSYQELIISFSYFHLLLLVPWRHV